MDKSAEITVKKTGLFELFLSFFKIGLFTFGGGLAMIAIIEKEVVAKKKWATDSEMLDMIIIAESTPGVLAVNTATSVGYKTRGVMGSLVATLGVVLPSFCIIFALSFLIEAFQDNKWYQSAFYGIQVSVCILIISAFVKMFKQLENNVFNYIMLGIAFVLALFTNINVIYIILGGAVVGIVYSLIVAKHGKKEVAPIQTVLEQNTQLDVQTKDLSDKTDNLDSKDNTASQIESTVISDTPISQNTTHEDDEHSINEVLHQTDDKKGDKR